MKAKSETRRKQPTASEKSTRESRHFPIVGVGASAGGLEAFQHLLNNLPTDSGMAFVLVQHLDPGHPSALTQLLSRATKMPVKEVTDRLPTEPNHVYVIPPNKAMVIDRGILKLQPRQRNDGGYRSIDVFLEALAQDQHERAIGVILSGTASDGTLGLETIKAEGGITFAQDDTAKYESMPRSAIAAGCVDFVLSPDKIAAELARIATHPYVSPAAEADGATVPPPEDAEAASTRLPRSATAGFKKILLLLRNHTEVDFSSYKFSTIFRRISRRMVLNKLTTLDAYAQLLRGNQNELNALFSDVLISVTSFFRNPEAFDILKKTVFPSLVAGKHDDALRVWVLGCSTGQEAYSIVMTYMEYADTLSRPPKIQVFATDLHDGILERARTGFYAKAMVADVSPERLRRFFNEEEGGYRINKSLRDCVVFARQNAITDPPFSRMDLISCRNLLIYLESALQRRILPTFHYALKPKGYLFLGASESVGSFYNLFDVVDKKHKIFCKKMAPTPSLQLHFAPRHPATIRDPTQPRTVNLQSDKVQTELNVQHEADRVTLFRYAPPGVLINTDLEVIQFRGDAGPYLKPASGRASFNVLKMARDGLMLPLRAAINKAKKDHQAVRREDIKIDQNGNSRVISFEVVPLKNLKERQFLIFFESGRARHTPAAPDPAAPAGRAAALPPLSKSDARHRIVELEQELAETRDYLQSVHEQYEAANEELQASNEEITSANEELQSINEELETAKEELEATNEELTTVNDELAHRNQDLSQANSDITNFQTSSNVAMLLLGHDLTVRRFTAPAAKQFNLLAGDIGRSLSGVRHNLEVPDLEQFIVEVIDSMQEREQEVRDKTGRWFSLRVRPYLSQEKKIEGAVLVLVDIDAIKRSAEVIRQSREFAEAIIQAMSEALLVLDTDLRVVSANAAFYRTFEVPDRGAEGRPISELGGGVWNMPKLRVVLEQVLARGEPFADFSVIRDFEKIGQRTILLDGRIFAPAGQPKRILLGFRDITESLRIGEAERRLAGIVESSDDAILSQDLNGNITSWNRGAERIFGYTAEEAIGQPIALLIPDHLKHESEDILARVGRGESVEHFETVRRRKDGSEVDISLTVSPLRDEYGKIVGASKISRSIAERKRSEVELARRVQQQQELYKLAEILNRPVEFAEIYEAALDAIQACLNAPRASILLFDDSGVMRFKAWRGLSDKYLKSTEGHSPWLPGTENAQPVPVANVADSNLGKELREIVDEEGIGALAFIPLVYQGSLMGKFMVYHNGPHTFSDEEIQLAQTIANQLSFGLARKKNEDALRAATQRLGNQTKELERLVDLRTVELTRTNRQLESFVYSVAHDLRGPLRAMQGFSEMLLEETALSEPGRDFASRVNKSAQYMDRLLTDLLIVSRLSQQQVDLVDVNLEAAVKASLTVLDSRIKETRARVELLGRWPAVKAHEPTLSQVLVNLIDNALKFVPENASPAIRVYAEERGDAVRVWIEDNGIGIPAQYHDQIFRIFSRLHGNAYPGTGVGLAIVQRGVERMGGRVGVESTEGRGSRFWFELAKS